MKSLLFLLRLLENATCPRRFFSSSIRRAQVFDMRSTSFFAASIFGKRGAAHIIAQTQLKRKLRRQVVSGGNEAGHLCID